MYSLRQWLGVEIDEVSWREKLASIVGGGVAILVIVLVSHHWLGYAGAPMLVASMGASAVLLFAVPHGQLSQPWPVLLGHVSSALIGVACSKLIGNRELAAACAVGLAIGAMHQFKFVHPPGGATALTAVMGGTAVTRLGFGFVVRPVLLNAVTILVVAVVFNGLFPWRRYPVHLVRRRRTAAPPAGDPTHESILDALRTLDSFVDITEDDLVLLHRLLTTKPSTPA